MLSSMFDFIEQIVHFFLELLSQTALYFAHFTADFFFLEFAIDCAGLCSSFQLFKFLFIAATIISGMLKCPHTHCSSNLP